MPEVCSAEATNSLRVLSLNLLADGLAAGGAPCEDVTPLMPAAFAEDERAGGVSHLTDEPEGDAFRFVFRCAHDALEWELRWPRLLALILEQDPDVVGLQEVDLAPGDGQRKGPNPARDAAIRRDLAHAGYDGRFVRKFGRALDGVGLFWRRSRLRPASGPKTLALGSVFVALAQPLKFSEESCACFTAVVTHLKAGVSAEAESARTVQARELLRKLEGQENVVLLADLNAHCRPWLGDKQALIQPQAYPLLCRALRSAYSEVLGDEPAFTSWGGWAGRDVRGVFDYVFVRGPLFRPWRVLCVPSGEDVLAFPERLPNPEHPTDHVPMVAELLLTAGPGGPCQEREAKRLRQ